jgi:carboxymethylenebutenolidase
LVFTCFLSGGNCWLLPKNQLPPKAPIKAALAGEPNTTIYSYPGQWHAFTRINGAHYNAAAAALANGRTNEFLNQQLR